MTDISFCIQCGTARPAGAIFCPKCGAKYPTISEPAKGPTPQVAASAPQTLAESTAATWTAVKSQLTGDPAQDSDRSEPMSTQAPGRRSSMLDGIAVLGVGPWSLIAGIGMAIGLFLPWAQGAGFVSLSVAAVAGIGQDLGLSLADAGAAVALAVSAWMVLDPGAARNASVLRTYVGGAIVALTGVGLVLLEFMSASQNNGGLFSSVVGPGIGIFVTGASAVVGLVASRPRHT